MVCQLTCIHANRPDCSHSAALFQLTFKIGETVCKTMTGHGSLESQWNVCHELLQRQNQNSAISIGTLIKFPAIGMDEIHEIHNKKWTHIFVGKTKRSQRWSLTVIFLLSNGPRCENTFVHQTSRSGSHEEDHLSKISRKFFTQESLANSLLE